MKLGVHRRKHIIIFSPFHWHWCISAEHRWEMSVHKRKMQFNQNNYVQWRWRFVRSAVACTMYNVQSISFDKRATFDFDEILSQSISGIALFMAKHKASIHKIDTNYTAHRLTTTHNWTTMVSRYIQALAPHTDIFNNDVLSIFMKYYDGMLFPN